MGKLVTSATAITFSLVFLMNPEGAWAAKKHWYCVVKGERLGPRCESCWSYVGGEGGRVACGVIVGPGSVHYGKCDLPRHRMRCR